jgi:hypothetical protein
MKIEITIPASKLDNKDELIITNHPLYKNDCILMIGDELIDIRISDLQQALRALSQ